MDRQSRPLPGRSILSMITAIRNERETQANIDRGKHRLKCVHPNEAVSSDSGGSPRHGTATRLSPSRFTIGKTRARESSHCHGDATNNASILAAPPHDSDRQSWRARSPSKHGRNGITGPTACESPHATSDKRPDAPHAHAHFAAMSMSPKTSSPNGRF